MDAKYTVTSINTDVATGMVKLISFTAVFTVARFPGAEALQGGTIAPVTALTEAASEAQLVDAVRAVMVPQLPGMEPFLLNQLEMDYLAKTTKVITKVPEIVPSLTSRRFWLAALEIGITKDSVAVTIDGMNLPTLDAQRMKTELMEATEFEHDNPVLIALVSYLNIPQAQFDTLWHWAMDL